jgi:tRNA pseudouridine13 synthase
MAFLAPGPFLTHDLPGIGGRIKSEPEDFIVVEERSRPEGEGDFVHAFIEKRRMSTPELLRRLTARLRVPSRELGCAGYKDADAVTRQWISAPARCEDALRALELERAQVLDVARARRPLKPGDLAGNRFVVVVRDVGDVDSAMARARSILDVLERRGVPNGFGAQRFGIRGESGHVGRKLIAGDARAVLDAILGAPSDLELDPKARAFRSAYARGDIYRALKWVPDALRLERALLRMVAEGASPEAIVAKIAPRERRFFLAAYQALVFNRILARRLADIDRVLPGDLLFEPATRAVAPATSFSAPQAAVDAGELHPTGPLFGLHTPFATDQAGAIEHAVFDAERIDPARLKATTGLDPDGHRRPLRFVPRELEVRPRPELGALEFRFALAPGCFATALIGEISKVAGFPV